jgi:UDP-N-acetylmuramyl pentapeptide phosphotransferase/UDP-N-acetylglucosamine-1-phosphate transferase
MRFLVIIIGIAFVPSIAAIYFYWSQYQPVVVGRQLIPATGELSLTLPLTVGLIIALGLLDYFFCKCSNEDMEKEE